MKLLILSDAPCDISAVLESCTGVGVDTLSMRDAVVCDISAYDAYFVNACGKVLDARLRSKLETACADKDKRLFASALTSFGDVYSADGVCTVRSRLVYIENDGAAVTGLCEGDLLDDECGMMYEPYCIRSDSSVILRYKERIIAHAHTNAPRSELESGKPGLWITENVMLSSFEISNFSRARFAPRKSWESLISFIAQWLTGHKPTQMPRPPIRYGAEGSDFDTRLRNAQDSAAAWLENYLVDGGAGGILEGLRHGVHPDGSQDVSNEIRTDCSGEAAGALRFFSEVRGGEKYAREAEALEKFVYGPMLERDGVCRGMLRWSANAWGVCYGDDVARAILPTLLHGAISGKCGYKDELGMILDFLVSTTAKDGCRVFRTDRIALTEESIRALSEAEHGLPSAHYNAYYHAALILGAKILGNEKYLDAGRRGLETIMSLYPNTHREQSETEEMCRLIFPLAVLYEASGEEKHLEMLCRVTDDLERRRHPSGGYLEWDTGYKAACSRESTGECSVLTENGDPVADLLYSVNWLPIAFAYAYHATDDSRYTTLWRGITEFFLNTQVRSENKMINGSWCRAFDMDRDEAYANPHDAGWAAYASESGWTNAEILMGMLLPGLFEKYKDL